MMRADRWQDFDEPVREQDQVYERGRLFERLQHPVAGLVSELVDALDDEHPPSGLERCPARGRDHGSVDIADEDLVRAARRYPGQVVNVNVASDVATSWQETGIVPPGRF